MNVSIRIFGFPFDEYLPLARACDELGFHAVWIPDHLVAPLEFAPEYPYRASGRPSFVPETPYADAFVMLGHLAAATTRIHLGVGVYVLPLRNPFAVARAAATVQELSGGRLILGVGVGWMREEFEAVGEPFERRGARTDEMLAVMRKLWSGQPVDHEGEWYRFPPVQMSPPPRSPIPIVIGGASPAALRRAARTGDGWYGPPCSLEEAVGYRDELERVRDREGTAARPFRVFVRVEAPVTASRIADYARAGLEDLVVDVPRDVPELESRIGWLRELAASLEAR